MDNEWNDLRKAAVEQLSEELEYTLDDDYPDTIDNFWREFDLPEYWSDDTIEEFQEEVEERI